jgi:hypothetical protein
LPQNHQKSTFNQLFADIHLRHKVSLASTQAVSLPLTIAISPMTIRKEPTRLVIHLILLLFPSLSPHPITKSLHHSNSFSPLIEKFRAASFNSILWNANGAFLLPKISPRLGAPQASVGRASEKRVQVHEKSFFVLPVSLLVT